MVNVASYDYSPVCRHRNSRPSHQPFQVYTLVGHTMVEITDNPCDLNDSVLSHYSGDIDGQGHAGSPFRQGKKRAHEELEHDDGDNDI